MAVEKIDLVRDTTMQQIAGAVAAIAANTGGYKLESYKDIQTIVRSGLADNFFHIGDQIVTEKETAITATVGNSEGETGGISAAAVNVDTFIATVGNVHSDDYEFTYNGVEWHYNGIPVSLTDYGITVTGTPVHGDEVIVHETAAKLIWDVIGKDAETPEDPNATHSLTLQLHDCYAELQFDNREALFAFPDGLTAGAYKFTIGAQPWYAGDVNKVITFSITQAIPAGGQLVVNNAYNATMVNSTISSYSGGASTTAIETVTMSEGNAETAATDLGTVTNAGVPESNINSIQRALLGSNNWKESALRQYLNSKAAAGSVWTPKTKYDRPPSWATTTAGFLNGLDPEFVAVLGSVKKVTALNTVSDGGGKETTTEKMFLLSQSEAFGGDIVTGGEDSPYEYYNDYSDYQSPNAGADSNRIKYRNGAAKYWWLRSPYTGHAHDVRYVSPSGTVHSGYYATSSFGVAPACVIV